MILLSTPSQKSSISIINSCSTTFKVFTYWTIISCESIIMYVRSIWITKVYRFPTVSGIKVSTTLNFIMIWMMILPLGSHVSIIYETFKSIRKKSIWSLAESITSSTSKCNSTLYGITSCICIKSYNWWSWCIININMPVFNVFVYNTIMRVILILNIFHYIRVIFAMCTVNKTISIYSSHILPSVLDIHKISGTAIKIGTWTDIHKLVKKVFI